MRRSNLQDVRKLGEFPSNCCVVLSYVAGWLFRASLLRCEKNDYSCVSDLSSLSLSLSLSLPSLNFES